MYNNLKDLIAFFVDPFLDLINDIGIGKNTIKIGFGNIEWFNFQLIELIELVLSFLVIFIFIKIIYKLLRLFLKVISGGVL